MTTETSAAEIRVVYVEDDDRLARLTAQYLSTHRVEVHIVARGDHAVAEVLRLRPDVVLLDLNLPGTDGLAVCREVRGRCDVPIIMVTARGEESDRVLGLEVGADDYLCKPFSMRELTARVRALLRRADRSATEPGNILRAGPVEIDLPRRRARRDGEVIALTVTEFDLLAYLLTAPGVVRSRDELLAEVWGYRDGAGPRTVDSHVRSIRRKAGADVVRTVHGLGYAGADGDDAW